MLSFIITTASYFSSKKLKKSDSLYLRLIQALDIVDMIKDLLYLYGRDHNYIISILFCQSIALPYVINVWACHSILFRMEIDGKPIEVKEKTLLIKTLMTHFGFEYRGDQLGDPDYPKRRLIATINTKLFENITQIALMLYESFREGQTISYFTIFNITFGLLMCI